MEDLQFIRNLDKALKKLPKSAKQKLIKSCEWDNFNSLIREFVELQIKQSELEHKMFKFKEKRFVKQRINELTNHVINDKINEIYTITKNDELFLACTECYLHFLNSYTKRLRRETKRMHDARMLWALEDKKTN